MEDETDTGHIIHQDTEAELDITLTVPGAEALLRHYPHVKTLYVRYLPDEDDEDDNQQPPYSVTTVSVEGMFSTLGDHQNILHLVLDNLADMEGDANCRCQFPVRALTLFLRKAKKLRSLQLDMDTAIAGTQEEGRAFLDAVREHENLKVLEIGDFGNENSIIAASEFSPLCVSKWVELTISHTGNQITREQVENSIVNSKCLKKLLIDTSNGGFPSQHMARVFEGLQENTSKIIELNLLDDFTEERALACASMIRENTTLRHLFVSLANQAKNGAIITEALLENSHIYSLRFVLSSQQPDGEATALVQNLRHNQTIRRIHFHFQGMFNQSRVEEGFLKPFEEIIEDNATLEDLKMDKCHGAFDLTPKIQFFLSLNRAGRKELLQIEDQSQHRRLLVDKVIQNRYSENIVFYFLSQNPSLLPASNVSVERMNARKRKLSDR